MNRRSVGLLGLCAIGLTLGSSGSARAFGSGDDRGSAGFKSLLLSPSARLAALGDAAVALPGNPSSIAVNPASAAGISRRCVSLSATNYVLDILPVGGIIVYPTRRGVWSLGVENVSYGTFDRVDEFAGANGTFQANDIAFHLGWGAAWKYGISAGVSFGWARSTIAEFSATALVANVGLLYETNRGRTTVGLAVTDLGTALSSYLGGDQGLKDDVPTAFHLGATHRPEHFPVPLTLLADLALPRDNEATLSVAAEARPLEPLALRVGYDSLVRYISVAGADGGRDRRIGLDDRHSGSFGGLGLSLGMGLVWKDIGVDYSYSLAGPFGAIHQLTAQYSW